MQINIDANEYQSCEEASHNRWSKNKGYYKFARGLINTKNDPSKAERMGLLGECAFGKIIGKLPNLNYIKNGDKYDFYHNGFSIDIKTSSRMYKYMLIRAKETEERKIIPLKHDVYVQAVVIKDDRNNKISIINILGFFFREEIDTTLYQSNYQYIDNGKLKISNHKNYHSPDFSLSHPIEELIDRVKEEL